MSLFMSDFLAAGMMVIVCAESGKALESIIFVSSLTSCIWAREKLMNRGMIITAESGALSQAVLAHSERFRWRCSPEIPLTL